jgi:hypothetical protein
VDEFLDGRLVGAIVAGWPQGVSFVQRPIVQDFLVNRARRDEHKSAGASGPRCLDQSNRSHHIFLDEVHDIALATAKAAARMVQSCVNHGVAAPHEHRFIAVGQFSKNPFNAFSLTVKPAPITCRPMPAAASVTVPNEMLDNVTSDESGRTRYRYFHENDSARSH